MKRPHDYWEYDPAGSSDVPDPPPLPHQAEPATWDRPHWPVLALAVLLVLMVAAVLAGCGSSPRAVSPVSSPPATHTLAGQAQIPGTYPATCHGVAEWASATDGAANMTRLEKALGQSNTDAHKALASGDVTAMKHDGSALFNVATAILASSVPPPLGTKAYTLALGYIAQSGQYMSEGNFGKSTTYLTKGDRQLKNATDALNRCF